MRINNDEELKQAHEALKAIQAAMLARATGQQVKSYAIGSRNVTRSEMSFNELKLLENDYIKAIASYTGNARQRRARLIPCD